MRKFLGIATIKQISSNYEIYVELDDNPNPNFVNSYWVKPLKSFRVELNQKVKVYWGKVGNYYGPIVEEIT